MAKPSADAVVLFDGVCNLCNRWVNLLIDLDRRSVLRFASLQSPAGKARLEQAVVNVPVHARSTPANHESIVFVEGGHAYERSTAVLRIFLRLGGLWPLLGGLLLVPPPIRDALYRWVARNRYSWFGKSDTCRVPTSELRGRFLEEPR